MYMYSISNQNKMKRFNNTQPSSILKQVHNLWATDYTFGQEIDYRATTNSGKDMGG